MIIKRDKYMKFLNEFKDNDAIKVITGIRRSGKTFLMNMFIDQLKDEGIHDDQIIHINFEDLAFNDIRNEMDLYKYVHDHENKEKKNYLFFDEIQNVQNWEKAINSFRVDMDADIYIDTISHKPVALFSKRKLETKIGGASKTISFRDQKLVDFVCGALNAFKFNGPIDMDLWYRNGEYYISEVNPRFGGAYLHAYGAGVDFVKLIEKNVAGEENTAEFNNYDDNVVMMMYDSVVIQKIEG